MYSSTVVVLPAADADHVPQNSSAACAVEIRPVELTRNMTLCGPVDRVPDALVRIVGRYQAERRAGEPFHHWARRTPHEELAATIAGSPAAVGS